MQVYPPPAPPNTYTPNCIKVNHNINYGLFLLGEETLAAILNQDSDRFLIERIVS